MVMITNGISIMHEWSRFSCSAISEEGGLLLDSFGMVRTYEAE